MPFRSLCRRISKDFSLWQRCSCCCCCRTTSDTHFHRFYFRNCLHYWTELSWTEARRVWMRMMKWKRCVGGDIHILYRMYRGCLGKMLKMLLCTRSTMRKSLRAHLAHKVSNQTAGIIVVVVVVVGSLHSLLFGASAVAAVKDVAMVNLYCCCCCGSCCCCGN